MSQTDPRAVWIVHGSRFGQSEKIARTMGAELERAAVPVEYSALAKDSAPDPARHRAFLLVTSVRYGYFDSNAYRLVRAHRGWLESVPTLLGTVSLTARSPEKRGPASHSYTRKFLEKSAWVPDVIAVMPGALEYSRYNLFDKKAIQLIMRITGGVTDASQDIDYTDWDEVSAIARSFAERLIASSQQP